MIIDFNNIDEQHLPHFKGGEKEMVTRMFTNSLGKIMRSSLEPGASIGYHAHEENSEIIYLLDGEGTVIYDDNQPVRLMPGQVHYCPMGHSHSLRNESDKPLSFLGNEQEHHVE